MIRAFVALELGEEMRERIAETVRALKGRLRGPRWVSEASFHLTMRFLGPSSPEVLKGLEAPLREAAARCARCEAHVARLGMFPERGSPRVLWLGVSLADPVLDLQAACEAAAVAAGYPPEGRAFHSHLTLARWRDRASRPELPPVDLATTTLDTLTLFRSDLHPHGAVYTPLATFRLGAA